MASARASVPRPGPIVGAAVVTSVVAMTAASQIGASAASGAEIGPSVARSALSTPATAAPSPASSASTVVPDQTLVAGR